MRLFIALPLGPVIEKRLDEIISSLKQADNNDAVKWSRASNIHITLKFLGETDQRTAESIKKSLSDATRQFKPVTMSVNRLGGFPNLNHPRVIWLGAREAIDSLTDMAASIDAKMHDLGFDMEDRPFKAHLTLGRLRRDAQIGELTNALADYKFEPLEIALDRVVLFKSKLTPQGPIYDRLHECMLGEERFGD